MRKPDLVSRSGQVAWRVGPRRFARSFYGYRVARDGFVEFPLHVTEHFGEPKVLRAADRLQARLGGDAEAVKLLEAA